MRKNNLSKYNFKHLKLDEQFVIEKRDVISMKNSLRRFNKDHKLTIQIEYESHLEEKPEGMVEVLLCQRVA